ncbi:MAG: glycoside hydrolase family 9 protein [Flavisolibacter sp.]
MVKKIYLAIFFLSTQAFVKGQLSQDIRINQVGYYPSEGKIAIVRGAAPASSFYVISDDLRDTLFKGILGIEKSSANSQMTTRLADFTRFHKKGTYRICVGGLGYSFPFLIADHVFRDINISVLKGFYFQRVGMALEKKYAGKWSRNGGHPDTSVLIHPSAASNLRPAMTTISTPDGWYDAGDYNKYVVNSGITMGTLFSAYEDFPDYFKKLNCNIPESGGELPDILSECLYNLRWMLTMQDPSDGGVYHKCTNAVFDPMVMPEAARLVRFVVQKSTAATLDFAAVMAQAARIFKRFSKVVPLLSDSCQKAATLAFQWALSNKKIYYNQNELNRNFQPSITTGGYEDKSVDDEWLWAAAELFITSKENKYLEIVKSNMTLPAVVPSWSNVTLLAYYSLIRFHKQVAPSAGFLVRKIKDSIISLGDHWIKIVPASAFSTVMGQSRKDFIWGSNSVAANQGILLINAYLETKNKKYLENALQNLDYILGRNATGYCFVTGWGSKSPMHPHHRISIADGIEDPVPGLLVGGPNPGKQDKCPYPFSEAETSYVDSSCAYASTEIAINWNAPLVYLLGAVEALVH